MFKSKIQNPKSKINPKSQCQISKQDFRHLKFMLCAYFGICPLCFVIVMSGCAMLKEGAKGIAGLSTQALEDSRKDAIKNTFNYDYNTCYGKVKDILGRTGSYIYAQEAEKRMIAVYVSESDTTPVGIFFKEIDANNTQVEVSSPSTYAKEFIASKVFSILEKPAVISGSVRQISVNISNAQGRRGEKDIAVPVLVSDVTGLGIISCQMKIKYDPGLITLTGIKIDSTLTQSWSEPVYNIKKEETAISLYGTSELKGSGVLVNLVFEVNATASEGSANLDLIQATFNDGKNLSILSGGIFAVTAQ